MTDQTEIMDVDTIEVGHAVQRREDAPSIESMMTLAVQQGPQGVEALERLVALKERMDDRAARQAFVVAMSDFRSQCPPIPKTRENTQFSVNRNGVKVPARYAPLEEIERVVRPVAAAHGLTWTWNTSVDDSLIHVTCKVLHVAGHYEQSTVSMPHGSNAGASPQQKYASSQTYGMRYSLISALGLTMADDDVDGAAPDAEKINVAELATLQALVDEAKPNMPRMLKHFGVTSLADLRTDQYDEALAVLEERRSRA
jgi:hypothetical protein